MTENELSKSTRKKAADFLTSGLQIDWTKALNLLAEKTGIVEDAEMARYLKVTPSSIWQIRNGRPGIGPFTKIKILDYLGFHATAEVIELLAGEDLGKKFRRARTRLARKIAERNSISKLKQKPAGRNKPIKGGIPST